MRRRDVLALIGGAAIVWSVGSGAQQPMPVVSYLGVLPPSALAQHMAAFRQGLSETGYIDGQNVTLEHLWADRYDRVPALAADLVRRKVDLIATGNLPGVLAAKSATSTIPIVFISADPLGEGLVASLARPSGNLTGVSLMNTELTAKRLELLSELVPQASAISLLVNPNNAVRRANPAGVLVAGLPAFYSPRLSLPMVVFMAANRLPAIYSPRELVEAGGLISYGANFDELFRQAAGYADRILKGTSPGALPVQQATTFELLINLTAAKALGLTIRPMIIARADEVIE